MTDDAPSEGIWGENLAKLGRATAQFVPKFPNFRKV